jgi:hypothetical protein
MAAGAFQREAIGPLQESADQNIRRIEELKRNVRDARRRIKETQDMERRAAGARAELARWNRERSAASAMVWFPARIKEHFQRFGIVEPGTRMNTSRDEPGLPGFQRTYWRVSLPLSDAEGSAAEVMRAVAQLEQDDPSVKVTDFTILPDPENLERRVAGINVSTLVRK